MPVHQQKVKASRKLLKKFRKLQGDNLDARLIAYLRTIDPYLFEELLLTALESAGRGFVVYRGLRYSGDGGFDGTFWAQGVGRGAVQAKRYAGHISVEHVTKFARQVQRQRIQVGLFMHTGRTGAASHAAFHHHGLVLVSGVNLTQLLLNNQVPAALSGRRYE